MLFAYLCTINALEGFNAPPRIVISYITVIVCSVTQIAEEVFSLTKINWNSTQMNQRLPIPIRAARMVGEVLKYAKEGEIVSSDYQKYI